MINLSMLVRQQCASSVPVSVPKRAVAHLSQAVGVLDNIVTL
jgi:hypothetical protein